MKRVSFDRNINSYVAFLVIAIVGAGAAFTIMNIMPSAELLSLSALNLSFEM